MNSLYLALRYLWHYKGRTATLVACVTVLTTLPLSLEVLRGASERSLLARAVDTPLVAGERGAGLNLVMNSLYFTMDAAPDPVTMQLAAELRTSGLADAIPLYVRFEARGRPVVGTAVDYFEFRGLRMAAGRPFALLGECVLGAEVARAFGLATGDTIVSSPETVFDLAGVYPLEMNVVGVLEAKGTADDRAVFTDIKTTWVMQGLVHGHQDLEQTEDPSLVVRTDDGRTTATAKVYQYTQITEQNIDSFHFHGDPASYPLTAVLPVPRDRKSAVLLRGRYVDTDRDYDMVVPREAVAQLLERIFRIKRLLQGGLGVVSAATAAVLVLVFSLSLRLRRRELATLFKLGAARGTVSRLVSAEITIIVMASVTLSAICLWAVAAYGDALLRMLILTS